MQRRPLLQCRPHCPVQAVLQIELAFPLDHMREQISVERAVFAEQLCRSRWDFVVTSSSMRT